MDETPASSVGEDTPPAPTQSRAARHLRHHRSHRRGEAYQRVSRRFVLAIALSVSLLALFLVIIFSVVRISGLVREDDALQAELARTRQALSQTAPALKRTRKEMAEMVKGRLPHLRDLVTDKVLKIDGPYLKNIVFTVLTQNGSKRYEYRLVMENRTARTLHPEARILVFDSRGVQIGGAKVAGGGDLAPGESRSQSSVIDRFIDEEARYFYVSTLPSERPAGVI
jgi:hypothetical protein